MKILITGGCGFVGHHMVEHFLKTSDYEIVVWDKLTYASSGFDRIKEIQAYNNKRVTLLPIDFTRPVSIGVVKELSDVDYILHMGAETHVDNSIKDPLSFVYANVVGTANMLEFARQCKNLQAFVYFSTDEVYGPARPLDNIMSSKSNPWDLQLQPSYHEWDRYNSGNPYSATKAGAEQLTLSYMNTYGLPGYISSCMNIFGERQHQEKFIPICIRKIKNGEEITIHGDATAKKSGARFYIHARNVAAATSFLMKNFKQRDKYNIVGEAEITNLELAQMIADIMGKKLIYKIVDFHSSRPGHDLRYALSGDKLKSLGFDIPVSIEKSLAKTVEWTLNNPQWI
jgi:dTDP-glucose 4,6-dehydratase